MELKNAPSLSVRLLQMAGGLEEEKRKPFALDEQQTGTKQTPNAKG